MMNFIAGAVIGAAAVVLLEALVVYVFLVLFFKK